MTRTRGELSGRAGLRNRAVDRLDLAQAVQSAGRSTGLQFRRIGEHRRAAATAGGQIRAVRLDPLAQALALATGLALAYDQARLAGVLGALCCATRPEWGLVLASAAFAGLAFSRTRVPAARSLLTGTFVLAGVLALLRPPIAMPPGGPLLLGAALLAGTALQAGAIWAGDNARRAVRAAAVSLGVIAVLIASGRVPALTRLFAGQWPLLALAVAGLLGACRYGPGRPALMLLAGAVVLGGAYAFRNPGSERYAAQLLPLACVSAGFVAGRPAGSRAWLRLAPVASALALIPVIAAPQPLPGNDSFAALAGRLAHAPSGTLISAAPDAYGFLLPGRPEEPLRPGARGLILLDGAQRSYASGLTANGVLLARLWSPDGFKRPNGSIDTGPALLVRGVVKLRR